MELQRIFEDNVIAARHQPAIAFDHWIGRAQTHLALRHIMTAVDHHAVEWHLARRTDAPRGDDRMIVRDLRAEEMDRAGVLQRRWLDYARPEALAGVFVDNERSVCARDRPEEAGRPIADQF